MKAMIQLIMGQPIKDYLWPDITTSPGNETGLLEGAGVSLVLALIYGGLAFECYFFGVQPTMQEQQVIDTGLVDLGLYTSLRLMMNLICFGSALFYIRSIAISKSKISALFLLIWIVFEVASTYSTGIGPMLIIYSLMLLPAFNSYRAVRNYV